MHGLLVHQAVIESGDRVSGVTVHLVDWEYDLGPIVAQEALRVEPEDTPESLSKKVLEIEHRLYPAVVRMFAEGRVRVEGRKVKIREGSEP